MSDDMTKTQEMRIPETIQDIFKNDPLGIYTHRRDTCRVCGAEVVGDVYCNACLALEVEQATQDPPIYVAEGMED